MLPKLITTALLCLLCAYPASAQLSLPSLTKEPSPASAKAPSLSEQQQSVQAQLTEVAQQREQALMAGVQGNEETRLLELLLLKLRDHKNWLDETAKLQARKEEDALPLQQEFSKPPPYDVLRVDALRDDADNRRNRLQDIQARLRALELEKAAHLEQKRRTEEKIRQFADLSARQQKDDSANITPLRLRIAETELSTADAERLKLELEASRERATAEILEKLVLRAVPQQVFPASTLGNVREGQRNTQERLATEITRVTIRSSRLEKERKQLLAQTTENSTQLQFLDAQIELDRQLLQLLSGMETLERVTADAWESRYQVMNPSGGGQTTALANLKKTFTALSGTRQQTTERLNKARAAVRDQALKLEGLSEGSPEHRRGQLLLATLQQRTSWMERLEIAATRLTAQLQRWLNDFEGDGKSARTWQMLAEWGRLSWNYELFSVEDTTEIDGRTVTVAYGITVRKSLGAILLFVVGYWLCALVSRHLQHLMVTRLGIVEQVAQVIRRWLMIFSALLLLVMVLNLARIPLTVFAFLGGALAIGVGFGTQTIIKNFISGIIILFERKIRVGDIIQLGAMTGTVVAVDLRASTVRGFDGVEALVPNSNFLENEVINWTYSNPRVRRTLKVGIAYGTDMRLAADLLLRCADRHSHVLRDPAPEVMFEDFADSAQVLALYFWVELGPSVSGIRVESDLRFAIETALKQAGIGIPFPQRELHWNSSSPLPVIVHEAEHGKNR